MNHSDKRRGGEPTGCSEGLTKGTPWSPRKHTDVLPFPSPATLFFLSPEEPKDGQVSCTSCLLSLPHSFCVWQANEAHVQQPQTGVQLNENQRRRENLPETDRVACNKMSSAICPPVLKAFVKYHVCYRHQLNSSPLLHLSEVRESLSRCLCTSVAINSLFSQRDKTTAASLD